MHPTYMVGRLSTLRGNEMSSVFCLTLGTISVVLFLLMMVRGEKYAKLVAGLKEDEFQLKDIYTVGFGWEDLVPVLGYHGFFAQKIRTDIVLFYGEKYAEFYVRLTLAKSYTYAHLVLCFFWIISGMTSGSSSGVMIFVGTVIAAVVTMTVQKEPKDKVKDRTDEYLSEFPNVVTKLALMIDTGMILREAWFNVTKSANGSLKVAMEQCCDLMNNGYPDVDAIYYFGQYSGSKEIKKFSSTVIQGIGKGNADLALLLRQQASELWEIKRQRMLQKGEEAATKLVIPTTMMFIGIILVIIVSAMSGMSL